MRELEREELSCTWLECVRCRGSGPSSSGYTSLAAGSNGVKYWNSVNKGIGLMGLRETTAYTEAVRNKYSCWLYISTETKITSETGAAARAMRLIIYWSWACIQGFTCILYGWSPHYFTSSELFFLVRHFLNSLPDHREHVLFLKFRLEVQKFCFRSSFPNWTDSCTSKLRLMFFTEFKSHG